MSLPPTSLCRESSTWARRRIACGSLLFLLSIAITAGEVPKPGEALEKPTEVEFLTAISAQIDGLKSDGISFLTDADHPHAKNEPSSAILLALAKTDIPSALHATAQLPVPQSDPIVRAILAAFPSREDATKAIRALPPATQPRIEAWHEALHPKAN